jgi:hypothetical protein
MKKLKLLFATVILASVASCTTDDSTTTKVLIVATDIPSEITSTSVKLGGNVSSEGQSPVTNRGICVGLNLNPVINSPDNASVQIGAGAGAFSQKFDNLQKNVLLHARAYATNAEGTVYGEDRTFTISGCDIVNVNPNNIAVSITAPTTWLNGKVYVIKKDVSITSVLTIEPGAIIKVDDARISINGSGKIIANGTATSRIIFTSIADDSFCGDTNGDGTATLPQKGDWTSIYINGGTNHIFKYCDFLYAGANDGGYYNAIAFSISGTSFNFDNCTFAHTLSNNSSSTAFVFYGILMTDSAVSIFTNNTFYDNDRPIIIDKTYTLNTNNSFSNPSNPNQKNTRNSIWIYGSGSAGSNVTVNFNEIEVPYVLDGYTQKSNGTMTIGPGVIMKFSNSGSGLSTQNNAIVLSPTAILTSYKDDTRGGDTNGDGTASVPLTGDWYGFYNAITGQFITGSNIFYAAN